MSSIKSENGTPSIKREINLSERINMNNEEIITDFNNLYRAFLKSKNNRSYKTSAMYFQLNAISEIKKIQKELLDHSYKVSGYTEFKVFYPKERTVKACKFRDKIVQHVLCDNILVPILPDICIIDNYAGQKGKGTGLAKTRMTENISEFYKKYGNIGYFYKGDISKYYYNIDHNKAIDIMEFYFPEDTHWLIEEFINSTDGNIGIALGNQINTVVSNLYLDGFDKFITGELGIQYYGRYADDFYLIHSDKEYLRYCEYCIETYLDSLGLRLNPKSQIIPLKNGVSFLGFHFYSNGMIRLNNQKKNDYRRKFNKMIKLVKSGKISEETLLKSFLAWKSHASFCTSEGLFDYFYERFKEIGMTIKDGYYISERTSAEKPLAHIDTGTLYLPFDIRENEGEEGGYKFKEYRVTIPITDEIDADVLKQIITAIPDVAEALNTTLKELFGDNASIKKVEHYKTSMELIPEVAQTIDDKTIGIAFADLFPVYEQNKQHDSGEVATHPETGYPYECMTAYDGTVQQDWTIDNRTLWKPWHSRKAEYALPWEAPTGAHDMYKAGEYMIWTDGIVKKCIQDTNFSPTEYPQAWEDA